MLSEWLPADPAGLACIAYDAVTQRRDHMGRLKLGAAIASADGAAMGTTPTWATMREVALSAEQVGFDTVWVADELLWEDEGLQESMGWWECVAVMSAMAEATTLVALGTWVLSALHRSPGVTVKAAEAIDEISGGRFIFGLGAGHSGRQGEAFGFPSDKVIGRYEEALGIVVPLLRDGSVTFAGEYHSAAGQINTPRGPQGNRMPLMLAGHGPRTMGLAVLDADIWRGYATTSSEPEAFVSMMDQFTAVCAQNGRDLETIGRSIGINIHPPGASDEHEWGLGPSMRGSEDELITKLAGFADLGFTSVEIVVLGHSTEAVERLAPVIAAAAEI